MSNANVWSSENLCLCSGCNVCEPGEGECNTATSDEDWPLCDACYDFDNNESPCDSWDGTEKTIGVLCDDCRGINEDTQDGAGYCPTCENGSYAYTDEAGCNDCDGWVYIGEVCESCGLKGWATRDTDDGLICDDCGGKDGAHYSDCRVYA